MSRNVTNTFLTFSNGLKIPALGLGTWKSQPGIVMGAVETAIDAGYRHIDCAAAYGNEKEVGNALQKKLNEGIISREDIFITSKLWNTRHKTSLVRPSIMQTLADLQLEYIDLYLIHWPIAFKSGDVKMPKDERGNILYDDIHFTESWLEMEKAVDDGLIKSIGLSNFNSAQIDEVYNIARVKPVMLQVECHPYLPQNELIQHCRQKDILVTGYSPLGSSDRPWIKATHPVLLEENVIVEIAKKYHKSPAQILISWQLQRGCSVIPKSSNSDRIKENCDVFDVVFTQEEKNKIASLSSGFRYCVPTVEIDGKDVPRDSAHPLYPFHIPF